jgi:hypothetical protein
VKVSSAALRRRISRSLVTVLVLSLVQIVAAPIFTNSALAYTQGTVTSGTAYGGTGGGANAENQNCTNGAIVAIGTTKAGQNLSTFMFVCKTINNDASLSATEATTNVLGTPSESDRCTAGQIGIGVRVIASNGGSLVGGVGLICGNPMSQGNPNTRSIMPDALSAGTVYTYTCPTGQLLAGFYLRTGALVDQITPKCSTFSAFVYAGIGSPTVTNLSATSSSVAFSALTSNFADTALQYTVTATPNSGSAITNTGSISPIAISNLRPNTSYTFSVTASNTYGTTAAATGTTVQSTLGLPSETDTALAITGTQYGWVADTGTNGTFDITGSITVEAWVYPTETTTARQYSVITKAESFQLFHIDGIWKYALAGGSAWGTGINTGIPVQLNAWHHIAFTRLAGTNIVNFYLDGFLVYTGNANGASSGSIADNANPFSIGAMVYSGPTPSFQFKGRIDHVALFDVVRTETNIRSDMNTYIDRTTSGLRAYFDLNEGSGAIVLNRVNVMNALSDLAIVGTVGWNDVKIPSSDSAYTSITFPRTYLTSIGGWRIPTGVSRVTSVVVAGGGGGNGETDQTGWLGGGGGAGGYRYLTTSVSADSIQTVQVGQGGRRGMDYSTQSLGISAPTNGGDSIFASVTSLGGGYGGGRSLAGVRGAAGGAGGSGGGGGTYSGTSGAGTAGQGSNGGSSGASCCAGAGGGGAGSIGGSTSTTTGGNAGDGVLNPLYINGTNAQYLAGGGAGGGTSVNGSAGLLGGVAWKTSAPGNSGSGGGGGGGGATSYPGGFGGSGVIIIKYLVASSKPIFSGPFNDTTTAGLVETFTVTGTPTSPLVRSYQWQVSTDTGTSWAAPTLGSGINSASYVTPVLTTSVSGNRYQYRVIVTDSDTAGLSTSETSSAVFLIINPALTLTGNTTIRKAINVAKVETFTVTGGTATHRYSLTPTISGITLDTSTALLPIIRISETKTVGTYFETLTVTDSVSATTFLPITIQVIAPPSFSATSAVIESGTVLNLDAASTASYPQSGNTWSDLSGRKLTANLTHNTGTSSVNVNGTTRTGATFNNSVQCVAPTFSNDAIGAMAFNGTSTCSYVSNFGYLPAYTYEVWLKRDGDQATSSAVITTPYRFTNDQINISLIWNGAAALVAGIFNGSAWASTTAATIPNQTWVHAAVTFNGSTLTLIINGDTTTSTAVTVTWSPTILDNGLLLGRKWDNNNSFKGSVGSIRIYDRVLALSEIQQNFNATKGRYLNTLNKRVQSKKYGVLLSDTYTVTSGADAISTTFLPNNQSAVRWDTSTARSTRLSLLETLTAGTYNETITATDSLGQSVYLPLSFTVTKADTITVLAGAATSQVYNGLQATAIPTFTISGLLSTDTATIVRKYTGVDWTKPCSQGGGCEVGDTGPGGGTIFYLSPTPINAATGISSGGTYLEVAPLNWSGLSVESTTAWAKAPTSVANTLGGIGNGAENTRLINEALISNSVAAKIAADLNFGTKSDWFLPSTLEVKEMFDALYVPGLAGNLSVRNYWTSTQGSNTAQADTYWFGNGGLVSTTDKLNPFTVRPIRAYSPDTITVTTVPTNADSYTVTVDTVTMTSGLLSNYENVIFQKSGLDITKARQSALNIVFYGATFGVPFTITVFGGTGTGAVTESLASGSTATGCAIAAHVLTSTTEGACNVQVKKAASRNYLTETTTASVYFLIWVINQPSNQTGGGATIAINGETSITRDPNAAPNITDVSASGDMNYPIAITGSGFTAANAGTTTIKFWRNQVLGAGDFIIKSDTLIWAKQPVGATVGKVLVINNNGTAASPSNFTPLVFTI